MDESTCEFWTSRCMDKKTPEHRKKEGAVSTQRSTAARQQSKLRQDARELKKKKSSGTC
jgi:hypothetical protein